MDAYTAPRRPLLALGSGAIMLLGVAISLFGIALYVAGWIGVLTASVDTQPAFSFQQILAERDMLTHAGLAIAAVGAPIMLVGMVLVGLFWLVF